MSNYKCNHRHDHGYTNHRYTCYAWCYARCCDWVVNMDVVKRRQQKLKYYRYCIHKARELMCSELRKMDILAGRTKRRKATNHSS